MNTLPRNSCFEIAHRGVIALISVFSHVGFPSEILIDLDLMQIFLQEFNVCHLRCSAYHPMTNSAIEKFNGTNRRDSATFSPLVMKVFVNIFCCVIRRNFDF